MRTVIKQNTTRVLQVASPDEPAKVVEHNTKSHTVQSSANQGAPGKDGEAFSGFTQENVSDIVEDSEDNAITVNEDGEMFVEAVKVPDDILSFIANLDEGLS